MDFFRPTSKSGTTGNNRMTGANINKDSEDRLKSIQEKRKDRREKINNRADSFGKNEDSFMKENEALRKNKDMTRKEFKRNERRDLNRLGFNTKTKPDKD